MDLGRGRPMPIRRSATVVIAGAVGLAILASACSSGFIYIKNSKTKTYFRVPVEWHLFSEDEVFQSQVTSLSPQTAAALRASVWLVAFDANPKPSLNDLLSTDSPYPQGLARVMQLSAQTRDSISLASLRDAVFPLDQLQLQDPTR